MYRVPYPYNAFFAYNRKDTISLKLTHGIRVLLKTDGALIVKCSRNKTFVAVSAVVEGIRPRSFTLERAGIKVHGDINSCLSLEIIEQVPPSNIKHRAYMFYADGRFRTIKTINIAHPKIFKFKSCNEVFAPKFKVTTEVLRERLKALIKTCRCKRDDTGIEYHFTNGLEVIQLPEGQVEISFSKERGAIRMNPEGNAEITYRNSTVKSSNTFFFAGKDTESIIANNHHPLFSINWRDI